MIDAVEQAGLALMIFIIMLGMGATIRPSEFKTVLTAPKALSIGLLCQFGLMPVIALCLALTFNLPAAIALSLIMVGATPGGTTSNLFTYYARGNVALSVSMTVASTIAAVILMPLAIVVYAGQYTSAELQIPYEKIVITLAMVMVPVVVGMFVLSKSEKAAKVLERTSSVLGVVLIAALIVKFMLRNTELLLSTPLSVITAAILLGLVGFLLGYWLARLLGLNNVESRTVSLETGIQNTPLTIAVIALSFAPGPQQDEMLLLPAFYAVFIVLTSLIVSFGYRRLATD